MPFDFSKSYKEVLCTTLFVSSQPNKSSAPWKRLYILRLILCQKLNGGQKGAKVY